MSPLEFARIHLSPFKEKGVEIVPMYCPFCKGGKSHDKYTFALNSENRTYNCKRGSCGAQGHFTQLCQEFGIQPEREYRPKMRTYKKPEQKPKPIHDAAMKYLSMRGISQQTAEDYRVGTDKDGNLMFPYYTDADEHVFNKFRFPRKIKPGEKKAWRETDTMPVLWGMHKCDVTKPLTICEGEIDAMACHESGIPNAVSVPSGAEDFTWIDTCWDFIQQFDCITLFGDNDEPGIEMIRRISVKLSDKRVCVVEHEFKDANELLYRKGKEAVLSAWQNAKEVPVVGLINLGEVKPLDISNLPSVNTSLPPLNKMIGGFYYGDVSVWTGKRGEGKSTVLSMLMLDAVQDGKKVCAYSGELRADRFQYWIDLQAAGKKNIKDYFDHTKDRTVYYVSEDTRNKIHSWYDKRFWLYDNSIASGNGEDVTILQAFEMAAKRYDCRVFLVDNLMTADYGKMSDPDFYRQQSRFVGQLVSFANKHNAHVHLVAHPRKTQGTLTNDDIAGSADITNRAANVITLGRTSKSNLDCDTVLEVIKNRWEGNCGVIGLDFCKVSRRLYIPDIGNNICYDWDKEPSQPEQMKIDRLPF